jgi:DNA-directed RNA polymerase specialized sigma subunit
VKQNESAITIIAVALGLCVTTLLVFGNFNLAYLVKLFSEGRVPAGRAFLMFAVTAINVGILGYLLRSWLKNVRVSVKQDAEAERASRPNRQQQWQEARKKVLELAQVQSSFRVEEVMGVTAFNRAESEYLLDELLSQDLLSVTQEAEVFKYSLKTSTPQSLSKVS